ncbi:hypothetical protein EV421DRAFT_1808027 [Armillaria borealis]|uniref:Plastocyanin-like domain-containing protein n=1 Tax=Armillaria borealis TaxID=47425 RepID=A0AA39MPS2_9AGAR|nr:hypothetical protein EV421DRAFT_1808027 [Armillaria borealis]
MYIVVFRTMVAFAQPLLSTSTGMQQGYRYNDARTPYLEPPVSIRFVNCDTNLSVWTIPSRQNRWRSNSSFDFIGNRTTLHFHGIRAHTAHGTHCPEDASPP